MLGIRRQEVGTTIEAPAIVKNADPDKYCGPPIETALESL